MSAAMVLGFSAAVGAAVPIVSVQETQLDPTTVQYTINNQSTTPFDITMLAVSTTGNTPVTTNTGWIAQTLDVVAWEQPMGGVSTRLSWHAFTGKACADVFYPGGPIIPVIGYFDDYLVTAGGLISYLDPTILFPGGPIRPAQTLSGFLYTGTMASTFLVAGPGDYTQLTSPAGILTFSGTTVPEPASVALLLSGGAALLLRRKGPKIAGP
jgi:hypothetical protein